MKLRVRPGITVASIGEGRADMQEHCWASQQWHPAPQRTVYGLRRSGQSSLRSTIFLDPYGAHLVIGRLGNRI